MKKIYTILRNNQHEGPFSLEELAGLSLERHDFIKIEGNRKGWLYAGDINELQPYFALSPQPERESIPNPVSTNTIQTESTPIPLTGQTGPVFIVNPATENPAAAEEVSFNPQPEAPVRHFPSETSAPLSPIAENATEVQGAARPHQSPKETLPSPQETRTNEGAGHAEVSSASLNEIAPGMPTPPEVTPVASKEVLASNNIAHEPPHASETTVQSGPAQVVDEPALNFEERIEKVRQRALLMTSPAAGSPSKEETDVSGTVVRHDKASNPGTPVAMKEDPLPSVLIPTPPPAAAPVTPVSQQVEKEGIVILPAPRSEDEKGQGTNSADITSAPNKTIFVSLPKTPKVPSAVPAEGAVASSSSHPVLEPKTMGTTSFDERVENMRRKAAAVPPVATVGTAKSVTTEGSTPPDPYLPQKTWTRSSGQKVYLEPGAVKRKKYGAVALAALVVATAVILGISFFKRDTQPGEGTANLPPSEAERGTIAVSNEAIDTEDARDNSLPPVVTDSRRQDDEAQVSKAATAQAPDEKPEPVASKPGDGPGRDEPVTGSTTPRDTSATRKAAAPSKPVEKVEVAKKPAADLTDQIYLASNFANNEAEGGIQNINVTLQNKSGKMLKTVAVIVSYIDNTGRLLNKQTLYFSDVKGGETVTRSASQHKQASKVTCELGLISSEGVLYYAN